MQQNSACSGQEHVIGRCAHFLGLVLAQLWLLCLDAGRQLEAPALVQSSVESLPEPDDPLASAGTALGRGALILPCGGRFNGDVPVMGTQMEKPGSGARWVRGQRVVTQQAGPHCHPGDADFGCC